MSSVNDRYALIIVHDFPPAGGPGVQRVLKFVKYLPEFGWQPVVLTAKSDTYSVLDETLSRDVPDGIPVYRAADPDVNRLRPSFNRFHLGKVLSAVNVAMMLPDANLFWSTGARAGARRLAIQYKPAVMLSSSPPASAHMLALWINRNFGVPWVADFRDPWSENQQHPYYPGYRALNLRMERTVLNRSDHVITVSPPLVEMFQRSTQRPSGHVSLIENGYDDEDIKPLPPARTKRFTIAYTGTFSRLRRPDLFIDALSLLVNSGQIPRDEIRIAMAGKNIATYIGDQPLVEDLGYLPHSKLVDLRRESDLLLHIVDDAPSNHGMYSGKVFEHLGCNRPTLCIADPDNVAAKLIVRARGGVVVPHDRDAIVAAILNYYRAWKNGSFTYEPDWKIIRQFTRRRLTERLAQIFGDVVDGR